MLADVILLATLGSLLVLLRHEIGPVLIHRPIAAGPLLGASVGLGEPGFLLGACLEWVWIDRIPAGGIRTPAVTAGLAAALLALVVLTGDVAGGQPATAYIGIGLVIAVLYLMLFVPLDGGLRRLWNLISEGVVAALGRGATRELRAYAPTVLLLRWCVVTLGLLTVPLILYFTPLAGLIRNTEQWPALWPWVIPAGLAALVRRRNRGREGLLAAAMFLLGVGWACWG